MKPMGKPKPGFEKRFREIFDIVSGRKKQKLSFWDRLKGKRRASKDELLKEWFANQTSTYDTLDAPKVGRDQEAEDWLREQYERSDKKHAFKEFRQTYLDYYVLSLSKHQEGIPVYANPGMDENVFRGQFLRDCADLIGDNLVAEAWETKLADETLYYGNRLLKKANQIAAKHGLEHLRDQVEPPEGEDQSVESCLHIVYSLARWLIFYGKNGHGYEADF